ncbi:hypothetical protein IJT17_03055 [bacterium]|nr:hypothetical protein [bacterium]
MTDSLPKANDDSGQPLPFFSGHYSLKIDSNGRFVVPAKYRDLLGDDIYLYVHTSSKDGMQRIQIWTPQNAKDDPWAYAARKADAGEVSHSEYTTYLSLFTPVTVDKQGRLSLPVELRDIPGGKSGEQVLVGCGNYLMLRTKRDWEQSIRSSQKAIDLFNNRYE